MKSEYIHIRISPELKEKTQKAAEAEGKTMSEYIIDLVKLALSAIKN